MFATWASFINENINSSDSEIKKLASTLKKKVLALQAKEFPRLRRAYAKIAADKLWRDDIYVTVQGDSYSIINLSGGLFAANKNIQETQESLSDILRQFHFKQSRYRWYKEADEFTYYEIGSQRDNELVTIK